MSKKILNHPDKEEVIKKLLEGDSVKEVERWLKEKYPRTRRLHISYMTLQKFRGEHLNLKGEVLDDIKNRRGEIDKEAIEASTAFGATTFQKLKSVQIPLALPTIFAGVNQTIMMALAMVVIASMIGVKGLGVPILRAISNQYLALGLFNGLAIVALAIIFDRITQKYGQRMQKHRGQKK